MRDFKIGIFNSFDNLHEQYVESCNEMNIKYEVIDLLSDNWIENVINSKCDGFLCSSTNGFYDQKNILDERHYFIANILNKIIYPSFLELYIHENKRNMYSWLKIHKYPIPETHVFLFKEEANKYIEKAKFPIVIKSSFGAGASKVRIVKTKRTAQKYANRIFPWKKWKSGNLGLIYFYKRNGIKMIPDLANMQKFYLLVQEFLNIKYEWRIIKIGDSYFGHQKLLNGLYASGSDLVGWIKPPLELLFLVKEICEKGKFSSMAIDIFETIDNQYLINELQSSFGSYNISQMYIDGKPCRYVYKNDKFELEYGSFNQHGSKKLRVIDFVQQLNKI